MARGIGHDFRGSAGLILRPSQDLIGPAWNVVLSDAFRSVLKLSDIVPSEFSKPNITLSINGHRIGRRVRRRYRKLRYVSIARV